MENADCSFQSAFCKIRNIKHKEHFPLSPTFYFSEVPGTETGPWLRSLTRHPQQVVLCTRSSIISHESLSHLNHTSSGPKMTSNVHEDHQWSCLAGSRCHAKPVKAGTQSPLVAHHETIRCNFIEPLLKLFASSLVHSGSNESYMFTGWFAN